MLKQIEVVAAVIQHGQSILATQRGYGQWKGWWEFPGGKLQPGESHEQALIRELHEEMDTDIVIDRYLATVEYDYPDFHLSMACYRCKVVSGHLTLLEHEAARWLGPENIESVAWLPADLTIIPLIKDNLFQSNCVNDCSIV